MLKYKFDVADALDRVNFNVYKAKKTGIISQDALKKVRAESTDISLKTLNGLCKILDMQPGAILEYVDDEN